MGRVTVKTVLQMKQKGQRIAMLTAYDWPTATLLDGAGIPLLLVGDSLGMVVQGHETTIPVTLDDMVYHTRMVVRGCKQAMVITDLPFLTYQVSASQALQSATRILQDGGAQAVKMEGGEDIAPTVRRLVDAGIPVMGHIGLTPQSVHTLGGFAVQGRTAVAAVQLLRDALALQEAGAFAIVLEVVPSEVASLVTEALTIPTIGIGAGAGCDGQVLVFHDMVGFTSGYIPKHNKPFANLGEAIQTAAKNYLSEVQAGIFPAAAQTISLKPEEQHIVDALKASVQNISR